MTGFDMIELASTISSSDDGNNPFGDCKTSEDEDRDVPTPFRDSRSDMRGDSRASCQAISVEVPVSLSPSISSKKSFNQKQSTNPFGSSSESEDDIPVPAPRKITQESNNSNPFASDGYEDSSNEENSNNPFASSNSRTTSSESNKPKRKPPPRPPKPIKSNKPKPTRKAPTKPVKSESSPVIKTTRKAPVKPTSSSSVSVKEKSPPASAKFNPNKEPLKSVKKLAPSIPLPPPREDDSNIDIVATEKRLKEIEKRMELVNNKLENFQEELEKDVPDSMAKKEIR